MLSVVYTDGVHLVADTLEELREFAKEMGLKPEWYQQKRLKHYDLTTKRAVKRALSLGATMVTSRRIVEIAKNAQNGE